MLKSKGLWFFMMAGALAGWVFAITGLVKPVENKTLKKIWKQVLITWALGHPLELLMALPIGRAAGLSTGRIIGKTLLFGITWWIPLYLKVFKK